MRKDSKINILSCFIAVLTAAALILFQLKRTLTYSSISHNEGWNAFNAWAVKKGVPLYSEPPGMVAVNYPPFYYWLLAMLSGSKQTVLWIGRLLSWSGFLLTFAMIFALLRSRKKSFTAAFTGALLFCNLLILVAPTYLGMNDPQILVECFTFYGAILALMNFPALAGLAFALGTFGKLNLVGFFVGTSVVFLLQRDFKKFLKVVTTYSVALGTLFLIAKGHEGSFIFQHLTVSRRYGFGEAFRMTAAYFISAQTLILLFFYWLFSKNRTQSSDERFFAVVFVSASAFGIFFSGGSGVNFNIFFESLFALCVFSAFFLSRLAKPALLLLVVTGVAIAGFQKAYTDMRVDYPQLKDRESDFLSDSDYLAKREGAAACEDLLLCFEAGKKMEIDFYMASERAFLKSSNEPEFIDVIRAKKFKTIQIDAFATEQIQSRARFRLTESAMKAILENYVVDRRSSWRAFFIPKP